MGSIFGFLKSKTVWGSVIYGASYIPALAPVAPLLQAGGVALSGVGVAHKLDKIKDAVSASSDKES